MAFDDKLCSMAGGHEELEVKKPWPSSILGGSWVVISRVISRRTIVITHIGGLTTPLITTHEPLSRASESRDVQG